MYLIFKTKAEADERSRQEAARLGITTTSGLLQQRYTIPFLTEDETYALPVSLFKLTEEERKSVVTGFHPFPYEDLI